MRCDERDGEGECWGGCGPCRRLLGRLEGVACQSVGAWAFGERKAERGERGM